MRGLGAALLLACLAASLACTRDAPPLSATATAENRAGASVTTTPTPTAVPTRAASVTRPDTRECQPRPDSLPTASSPLRTGPLGIAVSEVPYPYDGNVPSGKDLVLIPLDAPTEPRLVASCERRPQFAGALRTTDGVDVYFTTNDTTSRRGVLYRHSLSTGISTEVADVPAADPGSTMTGWSPSLSRWPTGCLPEPRPGPGRDRGVRPVDRTHAEGCTAGAQLRQQDLVGGRASSARTRLSSYALSPSARAALVALRALPDVLRGALGVVGAPSDRGSSRRYHCRDARVGRSGRTVVTRRPPLQDVGTH